MGKGGVQRWVMILLAIASLSTTLAISMNVLSTQSRTKADPQQMATLDPPVLGSVPEFGLTRQDGRTFTLDELNDKAWVANFVFTRCGGPCPAMTLRMSKLQDEWIGGGVEQAHRRDVRFVTFTVDPTHDTAQVLREYAATARADPAWWSFVTGDRDRLWHLIKDGFNLPVFENATDPAMPIAHSQKFVLVDRQGRIRGYYDATQPGGYGALLRDLDRVSLEPIDH